MKIKLTAQSKLVGYYDIPAYNPYPEVVMLGSRVFRMRVSAIKAPSNQPYAYEIIPAVTPDPKCQLIYDECFAGIVMSLANAKTMGIAFFLKQFVRGGKKIHTPELDGRKWTEYPDEK